MWRRKDEFFLRWRSLPEPQRCFLLAAYEFGRPRGEGLDVVMWTPQWRAVGAACGMSPAESDDSARVLCESGLIRVLDEGRQLFCLTSRDEIAEIAHPRPGLWWRLWWKWVFPLAAGAALAAAFTHWLP
jgi:hypothetical protein